MIGAPSGKDHHAWKQTTDARLPSPEEIVAVLQELGANGCEFQLREVRKRLQVATDGNAARRIERVFVNLRKQLIVTERPVREHAIDSSQSLTQPVWPRL